MNKILIAFLLLINIQVYATDVNPSDSIDYKKSDFYSKVEAFIPNKMDSYTLFYNEPNGKVVDSLKSLNQEEWIIVTIDSVRGNWVRLKKISIAPMNHRFAKNLLNTWIPIQSLYTQLNDPIQTFKVYNKPDGNSGTTEYPTVKLLNLVEIKGEWLKVRFTVKGKGEIGWIHKYDVCPYPWTICGYF
jgi:hypothetical protein